MSNDSPSFVFGEVLLASQLLIEVPVLAVLEDNVDVCLVIEVPVKLHNVWVVKPPLDFEFSLHLREEVELFQHVLKNDLECDRQVRILLDCLEDLAEFTTSDCLDAVEVIDRPALLFFFFLIFHHKLLQLSLLKINFLIDLLS